MNLSINGTSTSTKIIHHRKPSVSCNAPLPEPFTTLGRTPSFSTNGVHAAQSGLMIGDTGALSGLLGPRSEKYVAQFCLAVPPATVSHR